ncbi:MAG: S8 family serine peptidase [Chloroflexi bacterium]|nr:S8 family serine peptidase [Chloroflexota bacterium]
MNARIIAFPFQSSVLRVVRLALVALLLLGLLSLPLGTQSGQIARAIVEASNLEALSRLATQRGLTVEDRLPMINSLVVTGRLADLAALSALPGVIRVTPDVQVNKSGNPGPVSTDFPDVVGANLVWARGYFGQDVTVAILDTGTAQLPILMRGVTGHRRLLASVDFVQGEGQGADNEDAPLRDPNGHGTHITGVVANADVGADGEYNGIAPGADLVEVRVLNAQGQGTYTQVLSGIQWVIDHQARFNIRVVNMSLYAPVTSPYFADPLSRAVTALWSRGIVVVVAAGNGGPGPMTIGVPGYNPYAITVGAFTDNYTPADGSDDYLAPFSAAGPTTDGFVKPDLIAPGGHIVSTLLNRSALGQEFPENQINRTYSKLAGTSQATAAVSGVVALMLSAHPELTPNQVKYRLLETAIPNFSPDRTQAAYSIWQQGAGRVSAPDAVLSGPDGAANAGLDIMADLAGTSHYQGPSYYDPASGQFKLLGREDVGPNGYSGWAGGYSGWAGGYSGWAGGYSGWAGGYSGWAGGYSGWAGGYSGWAGGYSGWAGGYSGWAGSYGSSATALQYANLAGVPAGTRSVSNVEDIETEPSRDGQSGGG